jgi:L-fucose mutarotase/ribose pyranase (RbsD/FucU family)
MSTSARRVKLSRNAASSSAETQMSMVAVPSSRQREAGGYDLIVKRLQILTPREPIASMACGADRRSDPWPNDTRIAFYERTRNAFAVVLTARPRNTEMS